ncbi:recombinase XerC [Actibacterium mucosum KCTC 23349]|uniref:Tyrosine recombinase XerC n=1 Tax=Actibacterium mucosum KCTC 23349 TaxID=1454373 RepID=A0A037ZF12_9RHOB|nr:tyrosine recombinase XerC [Actibacterium mucosum]KAJ54121.1 recombinase XerC [Actibacterium mucosum KCTC 23349]
MTLELSAGLRDLLETWLTEQRVLNNRADNTIEAYRSDLVRFLGFLTGHLGGPLGETALATVSIRDMRAWMAAERADGLSARALARALSAVKSFYRWHAPRAGFDPTPVLSTRAPRFHAKLPRPLSKDSARDVIETVALQHDKEWVNARDAAVITLLYGCGLRISEALGLTGADAPLPDVLRIEGKGGKERLVPVLPAAQAAVGRYLELCPHPVQSNLPLFRGVRGGPLNPRLVSGVMARARVQLGLPASATPHAMRHSFATHLLAAGGDLRAIQELLGHARLTTTQAYTAVDSAQIMDAYTRAHPKA